MSEEALIQAAIAAIVTIVLAYFQMRTKNAVDIASKDAKVISDVAAVKTEEVKEILAQTTAVTEDKLTDLQQVSKDTHTLVNSNMGLQLRLHAMVTKRLAAITGNEADEAAAELAEHMLLEHEAKQAKVDAAMEKRST